MIEVMVKALVLIINFFACLGILFVTQSAFASLIPIYVDNDILDFTLNVTLVLSFIGLFLATILMLRMKSTWRKVIGGAYLIFTIWGVYLLAAALV